MRAFLGSCLLRRRERPVSRSLHGTCTRGATRRLADLRPASLLIVLVAAIAAGAMASPVVAATPADSAVHGLGLQPTTGLPRGISAAAAHLAQTTDVPDAVDLSAWAPPVGDQGQVGSCASWATGYYYRYWLRNRATGETSTFAPMYLYSQLSGGDPNKGSSFPGNFGIMESQGIDHEADYPQGRWDYAAQPTPAEVLAAASYKITSFSYIFYGTYGTKQAAIEATIAAGTPVVLGIPVFDNFYNNHGKPLVDVPTSGSSYGNHAVFAPRYDAAGVWIENSWGTGWGVNGWVELSWAFINQYAYEGWTATSAGGSLTVSGFTSPTVAGTAHNLTVTAHAANGATATGYTGTVHFTSSDPAAVLPANYTFTLADAGSHTFSATLKTLGSRSISATDTSASTITGTQSAISVVGAAATYHAITPRRVLDTRPSGGVVVHIGLTGAFVAGTVRTFGVANVPYVGGGAAVAVPLGATAVTGNLTLTGATAAGLVALGPTMTPTGAVTTINFIKGDTRANNVTLGLGPDGSLAAVFRSTKAGASVQLIFDVTGFFTPDPGGTGGALYHTLAPGRVLDTRPSGGTITHIGGLGKFTSHAVHSVGIVGVTGLGWGSALVPSNAIAVTGNVTVTNPTSAGYVAFGPTVAATPTTSSVNIAAKGATCANGVTVTLAGGKLQAVYVGQATKDSADVIFDVTGFFTPAGSGGLAFYPIAPARYLDSSANKGLSGTFTSSTARSLAIRGVGDIPSDAAGISANLTLVTPPSAGFAFAAPSIVGTPTSSTVNAVVGQSTANGLDVALDPTGHLYLIWVGKPASKTNLQLDVTGYWK